MLSEEAVWFGRQLEKLDSGNLYPMCNLGSSTLRFRTVDQPYIDAELFASARALGHQVIHVDMKSTSGVDLVGDFADMEFAARLRTRNFKSVMCCNLLEHVVDREKMAQIVMSLVPPGGYIIASVPNDFPYHEDPIDTMFRPKIDDIAKLFRGTEIVRAKIVRASSFAYDMQGSWRKLFRLGVRVCIPFHKPKTWAASARRLSWILRGYRVACVILRRTVI